MIPTKNQDNMHEGKENAVTHEQGTDALLPEATPQSRKLFQQNSRTAVNQCPQTPAGRLPLAELIASGEDINQALNLTPVERVLWRNSVRTTEHGGSQETPALPRSKKRAYSSSPASSSQKKMVSKHFVAEKTTVQVQGMHKALKTPQGDPASDLWNRYSLTTHSTERQSPTKIVGRPFSQLMDSSSPQTPAQAFIGKEPAGFRRSFSCGTEWPTSAAKRRKFGHSVSHHDTPVGLAATEEPVIKSQKSRSRLSLLVDKLHGDLMRPSVDEMHDPAASADRSSQSSQDAPIINLAVSVENQSQEDGNVKSSQGTVQDDAQLENQIAEPSPRTKTVMHQQDADKHTSIDVDADSDFDDDELDLELFEEAEAPAASARPALEQPQKEEIEVYKPRSQIHFEEDQALRLSKPEKSQSGFSGEDAALEEDQDDEFGDDANDVSAEDLEDVIAMFDSQLDTSSTAQPGAHARHSSTMPRANIVPLGSKCTVPTKSSKVHATVPLEPSSDDEFGGDLDFEQITAECSEDIMEQRQSTVCIRYFGSST